jgi:predicted dinucleotide-utilizing enzyme
LIAPIGYSSLFLPLHRGEDASVKIEAAKPTHPTQNYPLHLTPKTTRLAKYSQIKYIAKA